MHGNMYHMMHQNKAFINLGNNDALFLLCLFDLILYVLSTILQL